MEARTRLEFSAAPLTLGDMIDVRKITKGDLEVLSGLLQRRAVPPATEEEVRALQGDELIAVVSQLTDNVLAAAKKVVIPMRMGGKQ